MIDRLISGAGAVADGVNRGARRILNRGRGGGLTGDRHVAAVIGLVLLGIAAYATTRGLEATANPEPRAIGAAEVHATGDFGGRTFVTVSGRVSLSYVETYEDTNDNGLQDPTESGREWFYFLVDPRTSTGVTVRSDRRPEDVYRVEAAGTLVEDPEFVAPDLEDAAEVLGEYDLSLNPDIYLDATGTPPQDPSPLAFGAPWLAGEEVAISGVGIGWYSWCTTDLDGDGVCSADEIDRHDLIVYDPGTLQAIVVALDAMPTFTDEAFTGMLRRDPGAVTDAREAPGQKFEELGISVSPTYYLADGQVPADPTLAFGVAIVLAALGGVLLIGVVGGYVVYRRQTDARSTARAALELGEGIPLRVTGRLVTPTGFIRVREAPAALRRVTLLPISAAPELFIPPPGWTAAGSSGPARPGGGIPGWVAPDAASMPRPGGAVGWVAPDAGAPWGPKAPAARSGEAGPLAGSSRTGAVPSREDWIRGVPDIAPAEPLEPPAPAGTAEPVEPPAPAEPLAPAETAKPPEPVRTTLVVERLGLPEGIAVGAGETTRLSVGRVVPFRGERPAIHLLTAAGPLLLSFDDEGQRDRAATELVAEAGLTRAGDGTATLAAAPG